MQLHDASAAPTKAPPGGCPGTLDKASFPRFAAFVAFSLETAVGSTDFTDSTDLELVGKGCRFTRRVKWNLRVGEASCPRPSVKSVESVNNPAAAFRFRLVGWREDANEFGGGRRFAGSVRCRRSGVPHRLQTRGGRRIRRDLLPFAKTGMWELIFGNWGAVCAG